MAVPHKYGLIVCWSAEDEVLVVDVPELSGGMAHGATPPTPTLRRREAIQLWLDTVAAGRAILEPKGRRLLNA